MKKAETDIIRQRIYRTPGKEIFPGDFACADKNE